MSTTPLLEVENLRCVFGGLVALDAVSFRVPEGCIKGVIGPNGAGKTTLFNVISGVVRPASGEVRFQGVAVAGRKPYQIARRGLSRTFQNLGLFANMSVIENVMLGRHGRSRCGMLAAALRLPAHRREERRIREAAMDQVLRVGLERMADVPVGSLSFGQRRMVELARALATEPKVLLLDEPASGLNSREKDDLSELIRTIRRTGVTVLLVEHDMSLVMDVCDELVVLNFGTLIAEGPPAAIRRDPKVVSVYLGGDFTDVEG